MHGCACMCVCIHAAKHYTESILEGQALSLSLLLHFIVEVRTHTHTHTHCVYLVDYRAFETVLLHVWCGYRILKCPFRNDCVVLFALSAALTAQGIALYSGVWDVLR